MSELCRVLILDDEFIMRQGMKHMMDWAKEGFTEYVNKIRIRHAKKLLEQKGLPISRIGSMVGYTEHSYFCRVFKRFTSETPSEYRRRMKQK